jgi:hypothetical protein
MAKRRVRSGRSKRSVRAGKQRRSARKAAVGTRTKEGIAKPGKAAGIVEDAWAPSPFALWAQQWDDPSGSGPSAILLRHPTAPFVARGTQIDETSLRAIALDYLTQAKDYLPQANSSLLEVFQDWLDRLQQKDDLFFGWLPLSWPPQDFTGANAGDPLVSFRIDPRSPDGTQLPDDTVVLLAGEKILGVPSGSGHGIRVLAHMHTDTAGVKVRITGMSASVPPRVLDSIGDEITSIRPILLDKSARDSFRAEMARSAGLSDSSRVQIRGVRFVEVDGKESVELRGTVGVTKSNPTPYSGVFLLQEGSLALISKVELVADAAPPGDSGVFLIDPASQGDPAHIVQRRPTRSQDTLNHFRTLEHITNGRKVPLYYPAPAFPEDVVVVCPGFSFEDNGLAQGTPKSVDLPGDRIIPEVRSNDFAAISAYWNVEQLFLRLAAYRLNNSPDPQNPTYPYFRVAKLPLILRYRSGVRPGRGKDGQTVNARVLVDGWKSDFVGPTPPGDRPELTIHCALANLSTRERKPRQGNTRSPAEPLGIAADPRWMWHEIGHVLLMACVGYLQFPFAHSVGDALAAIIGDAESILARTDKDANWRGATFPWAFIPRRHDRSVLQGWSWAGSMHYAAAQVPPSEQLRRKGYWTEQILSSSLFRLYRCIGGDTDPDPCNPDARQSASHYTVYLIMRGIQIYGTYDVLSRSEPDHLVTALMDADIGTGLWDVTFPFPRQLQFHRVGGCVHKVIRWAFEAQGMYGSMLRNAPGLPPPVDIYIRDLRPTVDETPYGDVAYGEGSYVPVSLHCNPTDPAPLWQADPNAITLAANGDISVTVGNRGTQPANNVTVDVWWHAWPAAQPTLPEWDASWTQCGSPGNPLQTINPGDSKTFVFWPAPPQAGNRYLLLARATCADDLANIDAASGLPCSNQPTPLIDLVANDNNLGLRVVARSASRPITVRRATRPGRV